MIKNLKSNIDTKNNNKLLTDDEIDYIIFLYKHEKRAMIRNRLILLLDLPDSKKIELFIMNNILLEKNKNVRISMLKIMQDYDIMRYTPQLNELIQADKTHIIRFLICTLVLKKRFDLGIKLLLKIALFDKNIFIRKKANYFLNELYSEDNMLYRELLQNENLWLLNNLRKKGYLTYRDLSKLIDLNQINVKKIFLSLYKKERSIRKRVYLISIINKNIDIKFDFINRISQDEKKVLDGAALLVFKNSHDKSTSDFLLELLDKESDYNLLCIITYLLSLFSTKSIMNRLYDFLLKKKNNTLTKWGFLYTKIPNDKVIINKIIDIYNQTSDWNIKKLILLKLTLTKNDIVARKIRDELFSLQNYKSIDFLIRLLLDINTSNSSEFVIRYFIEAEFDNNLIDIIVNALIDYLEKNNYIKEKLIIEFKNDEIISSKKIRILFILSKICNNVEIHSIIQNTEIKTKSQFDESILNYILEEIYEISGMNFD